MKQKTILCDMDDTSVDLMRPWVQRHYERTGVFLKVEDWNDWDLTKNFGKEHAESLFETQNEPGFFRDLPPKEGAIEGLRTLHDAGFEIVILTASPKSGLLDKYLWVEEHLPFINPERNLIHARRKDLVMGDYLIDDGPHNLIPSPAKHKIVFDNPWNRHLTQFHRVTNWRELVDYILMNEERVG